LREQWEAGSLLLERIAPVYSGPTLWFILWLAEEDGSCL